MSRATFFFRSKILNPIVIRKLHTFILRINVPLLGTWVKGLSLFFNTNIENVFASCLFPGVYCYRIKGILNCDGFPQLIISSRLNSLLGFIEQLIS